MSKESYFRGFCKAAEAAGVDPVALAKYARESASVADAGIGQRIENSDIGMGAGDKYIPYNPTSYFGRLFARYPGGGKGVTAPHMDYSSKIWPEHMRKELVSLNDLERSRKWQVGVNARTFYPQGSAPYNRVFDNLMNAGKENHNSYLETGDTKDRTEPNLQGIESLKLTPEQKNRLLQMQNTMASRGVPRTGNIA